VGEATKALAYAMPEATEIAQFYFSGSDPAVTGASV
jgi:hypothetical protein